MNIYTHTTRASRHHAGFSLFELLVVFAILLLLVSVTLASFGSYARLQQYQRFTDEVSYLLKQARQQTLASKDDTVYGLYIGTSTVELFTGPTPTPGNPTNTIIDFSGASYFATSSLTAGNSFVTFARVTGEASATGTILMTQPELGRTATITIHQSGLVE